MVKRKTSIAGLTVGLTAGLVLALVFSLLAGPLDPPPGSATGGTLVPTMKTLEQIAPSWDNKLPANDTGDPCNSARFSCVLFTTEGVPRGVRDNETGLVWMKVPSILESEFDLRTAEFRCYRLSRAFRRGWRLPTLQELASLLDPTRSNPALPIGHPFEGVQFQGNLKPFYWTSTDFPTGNIYGVSFTDSEIVNNLNASGLATPAFVWCVRGARTAQ